jgi:hypothetical protein
MPASLLQKGIEPANSASSRSPLSTSLPFSGQIGLIQLPFPFVSA